MTPRWDDRQREMLGALGLNWWPRGSVVPAAVPAAVAAAPVAVPAPAPSAPIALREVLPVVVPRQAPVVVPDPALSELDWDPLEERIRACKQCGLCAERRQAVPGVGHRQARWLIVGEGPGEQEDAQGEPFVGPSGQLLDAMLGALSLSRAEGGPERQVYIANAVKCRPPRNRNPEPDEIAACRPYLLRQIELIQPRLILALGRIAVQSLLGSDAPLGRLRGQIHEGPGGVPVVVSYHPAYLLRNPQEKARAWEDLCLAAERMESPR